MSSFGYKNKGVDTGGWALGASASPDFGTYMEYGYIQLHKITCIYTLMHFIDTCITKLSDWFTVAKITVTC